MTRRQFVPGILILTLLAFARSLAHPQASEHQFHHVAPDGLPNASGEEAEPLNLIAALSSPVQPGDVVLLRRGAYHGSFVSNLTGAPGKPIVVMPYPGERAIIDGSLTVRGAWTIFRSLEVTNSDPDRSKPRPPGVSVQGPHTKLVNLVIHDAGDGAELWTPAIDAEMYGCIVYHNGWQAAAPARGSGHAVYTQNETGTKRIVDNILFNNFGWGIHAYTEGGALKGFHFEGNTVFNNGSPTREDYRYDNILVGGLRPAERVTVIANYTYHTPGKGGRNRLGYSAANHDADVRDNYFVGGNPVLGLLRWEKLTLTGNTFFGLGTLLGLTGPKGATELPYAVDDNTYFSGGSAAPFVLENKGLDFEAWQQATGFDAHSRWIVSEANRPTGVKIFVRPNQYQHGRAHIVVYNWDRQEAVQVDLGSLLKAGEKYEVRNVLRYFDAPVAAGTFSGDPISLRMTGAETGPEFNAFVLSAVP